MNYAIFRSEPIYTLSDLAQIGSHNQREKKSYKSNPDIKIELSNNNIQLIPLSERYVKGFYSKTLEYRKEHDERMKTERTERKKTFNQMLNKSKNVVADELLFTATNEFFNNMSEYDIKIWANTCMEFVYQDLGYTKDQVLHSTIHLDEKTPHIHCVVIPLIKKLDKRTNTERYTISKKQFIKDKLHLSELQDKYHKRLTDKGFDLERCIKNSDNVNINIKEYKKITRKLNHTLNVRNDKLNETMSNLESKMQTNKETMFDKEYVKVKKDTFDSMNKVIKETKKVMEVQPKLQQIFKEVDSYTESYQSLQKQNYSIQREIKHLRNKNNELQEENKNLKSYIKAILEAIKHFFRELLQIGNEPTKDATTSEIKDYYDNQDFDMDDVVKIAKTTTKEDELFDYVEAPNYLKTSKKSYNDKDKDDFEISL